MAILGDYIRIKHGFAFKGDYITTEDNGVVLVTPGNFEIGGGFKEKKCKFFSAEYPVDYVLHAGDLIVTMTDLSKQGDTLGFSALVPNSNRTYLHNQRIGLVDVFNPEADKDYIYWFMRTPYYQKTIVATASGSTVKHTSPLRICDVKIELPPLDEQKKISSILRSIDDKIDNNQKINDNLEQQISSIYEYLCEGKSWSSCELENLIAVKDGTHDSPKPQTDGYLLVTSKHLLAYGVDRNTPNRIAEKDFKKINERSLVEYGDVLMSMIGTIGLISFVTDQTIDYAIKNVALFKTSQTPELAYYFLSFLKSKKTQQYIEICLAGSTQKYISLGELRKMPVPNPDSITLKRFNEIVRPMYQTIILTSQENTALMELRDSLLTRLISGELDISEIDI